MNITLTNRTAKSVQIYYEKANTEQIRRFLPQKARSVEEALEDYKRSMLPDSTSFGKNIYADDRYIGDIWCYCINQEEEPNCMLSYCIFDPEYCSKGIASKAVDLFIKDICEKYAIRSIGAFTYSCNAASVRVLEKNGFSLAEEFQEDGISSKFYIRII